MFVYFVCVLCETSHNKNNNNFCPTTATTNLSKSNQIKISTTDTDTDTEVVYNSHSQALNTKNQFKSFIVTTINMKKKYLSIRLSLFVYLLSSFCPTNNNNNN